MSFLHGSDFTFLTNLNVQRQDCQSPSRTSPKPTLHPDHLTLRDDAFHLAHFAVCPPRSSSTCPCQWLGLPTLQWCTSIIFLIFLVVGTVSRQSSGCSAQSLLSVLMTSSSSSHFFFLTSSISFQPSATPSLRELICHYFHQPGCTT